MERSLFSDANASPKRFKDFLDNIYGDSWYEWQSEALRSTLLADGHGEVHPIVWSILRAIQALRTSREPYTDYNVFEKVVLALNRTEPNWEYLEVSDPEEMGYAVSVIKELFPVAEFSEDIPPYVALAAAREGFIVLPEPLEFAQADLDKALKHTVADGASNAVLKEIELMKSNHKPADGDTLPAISARKYMAVLAYIDMMRSGNG